MYRCSFCCFFPWFSYGFDAFGSGEVHVSRESRVQVAWLEAQNVDARAESIRSSYLKAHIKELLEQLPGDERKALLTSLQVG